MSGLYVHIPFCLSRCIYCGFFSTTTHELIDKYIETLGLELKLREGYLSEPITTIYIGGGTPSVLSEAQLEQLFGIIWRFVSNHNNAVAVRSGLDVGPNKAIETTIECNPNDINEAKAATMHRLGVNRVSMGVQSFNDNHLQFIRRRHNSRQAIEALRLTEVKWLKPMKKAV